MIMTGSSINLHGERTRRATRIWSQSWEATRRKRQRYWSVRFSPPRQLRFVVSQLLPMKCKQTERETNKQTMIEEMYCLLLENDGQRNDRSHTKEKCTCARVRISSLEMLIIALVVVVNTTARQEFVWSTCLPHESDENPLPIDGCFCSLKSLLEITERTTIDHRIFSLNRLKSWSGYLFQSVIIALYVTSSRLSNSLSLSLWLSITVWLYVCVCVSIVLECFEQLVSVRRDRDIRLHLHTTVKQPTEREKKCWFTCQ